MRQISIVLMTSLMALLLACSFGGPNGSQGDVIWPLSVGSEWQGVATFYDSDGNITSQQPLNFLISGDTTIGNETWYFMSTYIDDEPVVGSYWVVTNRNDGLHQILFPIAFREPDVEPEENLWLKYPSKEGDAYLTYNNETIVVQSTNQIVTVPQGLRHCSVYEYLRPDGFARQYAAPGIGLVKIEVQVPDYVGPPLAKVAPGWTWELTRLVIK